ncbi:proSAAS-like protein [Cricetulus griseus]|uniref:ProSAAS-like protein n=1 Tax=Cricetulus griseus TaxID=10029 RepID=A0A061HZB8_CRIGR|nr:proSAAS-like protein [Cricetulus griseus]
MAWSPLLSGPRAGGVGLLVLLLLGLLRLPPALSARPVKVRLQSAGGGGGEEGGGKCWCGILAVYDDGPTGPDVEDAGDETPDVDPELLRYLLGRILTGSSEPEAAAAPRRLRRAADQDLGPEAPPESVLGALLRVKRLDNSSPQAPARRLLPP